MAPDADPRYDPAPPIPTYDEAIAGGTWQRQDHDARSPDADEAEGQSLLNPRHPLSSSSSHNARGARRPGGYRAPTVETDDEGSLLGSDSDSDSEAGADHVRREMQEMDIDDSDTRGARSRSSWGKRIGFALPQWRWRWRWKLPRIPLRRTPAPEPAAGESTEAESGETPGQRFAFPTLGSAALFLIVARMLAIMLVLGFLYLLFVSDLFTNMSRRMGSRMYDPASVRNHVKMSTDPRRIRATLKHFTGYAHLAGTAGDFALAEDTEMMFKQYGLEDVTRDEYYVYLNYPTAEGRAVQIMSPDGRPSWSARLDEDDPGGEVAGRQTWAFHGHSKSGDVRGPLLYANYGSRQDFEKLKSLGIDTHGAIALVRHGGPNRPPAFQVKEAGLAGFAGCLIFSDPERGAGPQPFIPSDGVQRDSVSLPNYIVGDVLTPEYGSRSDQPRLRPAESAALPKIPSLPLAWRDAQPLLQHLKNFGQKVPDDWLGSVPEVGEWWTGNASSPIVRLKNEQDEVDKKTIWNVYGRIVGIEQSEKKVIIGNHRDSWGFGAASPHSGTAVMMEVVRIFGDLLAQEWRPLRTIEFMSWDAGAYNMIGSTEYVEQNDALLRQDGFAYINLDAAVTGNSFHAAGSPIFYKALMEALNEVNDPNFNDTTLRDIWDQRRGALEGLGIDSDYVAFQDLVGTSSLDLRFVGDAYPSHSNHENFDWMDQVADPGFIYHTLMAQVVGLLILELADRPVAPFDMPHYVNTLKDWVEKLEEWLKGQPAGKGLSVRALWEAHRDVRGAVEEFRKWEHSWEANVISSNGFETAGLGRKRAEYNSRMARFESDLLDDAGIPNRRQFKHVLIGPQLERLSNDEYFPSIRDAVNSGDADLAGKTIEKVAGIIKKAADRLVE